MKTVLVILHEGVEELEAVAPIDLLRRAGAVVTTASTEGTMHVTGRNKITLHADTVVDALGSTLYSMVLLPGGPGIAKLRTDARVLALVKAHAAAGSIVAAICAAPLVLKDAGVLAGRRLTGHQSVKGELPAIEEREKVVVDGTLITSRGAGTAIEFGLACIEALYDRATANTVANAIHFGL
ncbi:MAG: DJ-1/PfpI family protein [Verrucomicrobiota bacterium]|nr:DJ-1/PfpI family protein [Verrucomicrobiota bacterium]